MIRFQVFPEALSDLKAARSLKHSAVIAASVLLLAAGTLTTGLAQTQAASKITLANQAEMAPALPAANLRLALPFPDSTAETKPRSLWVNLAVPAAATGALAATYFFVDHDLRHDVPNDESAFKDFVSEWAEPLGRSATIVPGFGGLLAYGLVAKNKRAQKAAVIGLGTFYLNDGLSTQLKKGFSRMRPSTGAGHDNWFAGEPHRSFPSSHTSTAFSAATVLASVYKDKKLVAPIAYSVATVVGFSRLYHNQHWASDVVGGALVGYLSAKAAVFTYSFIEKKWKGRQQVTVLPQLGPNGMAATAVISF